MCSYCRGKELKESTTTYVAVFGDYTMAKELNSEFFVAEYKAA